MVSHDTLHTENHNEIWLQRQLLVDFCSREILGLHLWNCCIIQSDPVIQDCFLGKSLCIGFIC